MCIPRSELGAGVRVALRVLGGGGGVFTCQPGAARLGECRLASPDNPSYTRSSRRDCDRRTGRLGRTSGPRKWCGTAGPGAT